MFPFSLVVTQGHGCFQLTACKPTIYFVRLFVFYPASDNRQQRKFFVRTN